MQGKAIARSAIAVGLGLVLLGLPPQVASADTPGPAPTQTTSPTAGTGPTTSGTDMAPQDPTASSDPAAGAAAQLGLQAAPTTESQPAGVNALAAQSRPVVTGSGASFPLIELRQWIADVSRAPYSVRINYQGSGSTAGRVNFIHNANDFGVSDIQFQGDETTGLHRPFVYIPISAGGLAFMYNLKDASGQRIRGLRLSPRTACGIFTGAITNWSDPAITADNGGAALRSQPIKAVVRQEGSGSSFVLGEYCIALAPDLWNRFAATYNLTGPTSEWPVFPSALAVATSDGCADRVADAQTGNGAITYVESGFGLERGFPVASMRNQAGKYVQPGEDNVTLALSFSSVNSDGTHRLNFTAKADNIYNPSTYSYLIAQTTGFDPGKGFVLGTFVNYSVTVGQRKARDLGYAALSPNLINFALDQVQKIPGHPPRPNYNPDTGIVTNLPGGPQQAGPKPGSFTATLTGSGSGNNAGNSGAGTTTTTTGGGGSGGSGGGGSGGSGGGSSGSKNKGPLAKTGASHPELIPIGLALAIGGEYWRRRLAVRPTGQGAR
jgi:phosphate transport system substrate-binding protein